MEPTFDPYREWLGLASSPVQRNYYQLLELAPFESRTELIGTAANKAMSRVRGQRPGPHARLWSQLLDELAAARDCLTDAGRKRAYDDQLRRGATPETAAATMAASIPGGPAPNAGENPRLPPGASPGMNPAMFPPGGGAVSAMPAAGAAPTAKVSGAPKSPFFYPPTTPATSDTADWTPGSAPNSPPASNPAGGQASYPWTQSPAAGATQFATGMPVPPPPPSNTPAAPLATPASAEPPAAAPWGGGTSYASPAAGGIAGEFAQGHAPSGPSAYPAQPGPMAYDPANPYGAGGYDPNAYGQGGYAQPAAPQAYAQPAYAQPAYGQQDYNPQAYGQQPGYAPQGYGQPNAAPPNYGQPAYAQPAYPQQPYSQPDYGQQPYGQPGAAPYGAADPMSPYGDAGAGYGGPVPLANPAMGGYAPQAAYGGTVEPSYDPMAPVAMPAGDVAWGGAPLVEAAEPEVPRGTAVASLAPVKHAEPDSKKEPVSPTVDRSTAPTNDKPPMILYGGIGAVVLIVILAIIFGRPSHKEEPKPVAGGPQSPIAPVDPVTSPVTPEKKPPIVDPMPVPMPDLTPPMPAPMPDPMPPLPMPAPMPDPTPPMPMPAPMPTPMPPLPMVPPPSLAELAALAEALTTARAALGDHNFDIAKEELAKADKLAKQPVQKQAVERVRLLYEQVNQFWNAVGEGLKGLKAADELPVGNSVIAVVEAEEDKLIVRVGGTNKTYTRLKIPMGIARTIGVRWLDKTKASSKLFEAAFLIAEPNGKKDEARQMLEEVAASGEKVVPQVARLILPTIDEKYDATTLTGDPLPIPPVVATDDPPTPSPMPNPPAVPQPTAEEVANLAKALQAARQALAERKLEIAAAEMKKAEELAKTPEHQALVSRLDLLRQYVELFWKEAGAGLAKLEGGSAIDVKGQPIAIVETGPDLLIIRATGANQRFTKLQIPGGIVMAIVDQHLNSADPRNKAVRGAFYAVEPNADRATARGLFEEAIRGGVDAGDLLKVLDDTYNLKP